MSWCGSLNLEVQPMFEIRQLRMKERLCYFLLGYKFDISDSKNTVSPQCDLFNCFAPPREIWIFLTSGKSPWGWNCHVRCGHSGGTLTQEHLCSSTSITTSENLLEGSPSRTPPCQVALNWIEKDRKENPTRKKKKRIMRKTSFHDNQTVWKWFSWVNFTKNHEKTCFSWQPDRERLHLKV